MKLIRFGEEGKEQPGVLLQDGTIVNASVFGEDYDESFFKNRGIKRIRRWTNMFGHSAAKIRTPIRLGPPIVRPSKIVCIGLNYRDHATETGAAIPTEPIIFLKATSALTGPFDDVLTPRAASKVDWEVELGVVINSRASYVTENHASDYIAGYVLANDISERSFQLDRGGQWVKGKSADGFAPLGPHFVTPDELGDPHNLKMWLSVNGETMQESTTANMIFGVPKIISYVSQFMTLLPGDVISTGTPAGVGLGREPQKFLQPGDVIETEIEGLGKQRQQVVAWQGKKRA